MKIVGVDFGTTNVRIATWDSEQDLPPQPQHISPADNPTVMPAVIALQRQTSGEVSYIVGEEAEDLEGVDDENTLVVEIIKRYAMSTDSYVEWYLWYLGQDSQWPPEWWNPDTLCVEKWEQSFPVWELIEAIIAEAFRRAGLTGEYEWRAGCPVHSDFQYRRNLAKVLSNITGREGSTNWIVEEPVLFLLAARKLVGLNQGTYLVYDIGGGSFDCALVEVASGGQMRIYGAAGHPKLGGTDIDSNLASKLEYSGQMKVLRKAKEDRTLASPSETLHTPGGATVVTLEAVEAVWREGRFREQSVSVLRDAYIGAKTLWKRGEGEDDPLLGEILHRNRETGEVSFVWQLTWDDMAQDVDRIILFGGPTKTPSVKEYLEGRFGVGKVIAAEALLAGVEEAALTGASVGACYSAESSPDDTEGEYTSEYTPMFVNRLPVRITLEDLKTGAKINYEPYELFNKDDKDNFVSRRQKNKLLPRRPFADAFVSRSFLQEELDDPYSDERYELTVSTPEPEPEGRVIGKYPVDPLINTTLAGSNLRLVIDLFGRVAVIQQSEKSEPKTQVIIEDPPWQTTEQAQFLWGQVRQSERYRDEDRARIYGNLTNLGSDWRQRLKDMR